MEIPKRASALLNYYLLGSNYYYSCQAISFFTSKNQNQEIKYKALRAALARFGIYLG
jgi:hypothetical protein